ncbi:MAG: hypothetical protein IJN43_06665 [Ruminococcus sp.]|nr:hypothetical protein [Ruminococcus sp.]
MDYSLDVIVSKSDLDNIGFKEKTFIWEGREHSLSPREFFIDDNIIFLEVTHGTIYDILLRDTEIHNPVILTLYRKYNSVEKVINNDRIMTLYNNITKIKKVELYLWKDDEVIDKEYKFEETMNVSKMMKEAIENNKNILIYR